MYDTQRVKRRKLHCGDPYSKRPYSDLVQNHKLASARVVPATIHDDDENDWNTKRQALPTAVPHLQPGALQGNVNPPGVVPHVVVDPSVPYTYLQVQNDDNGNAITAFIPEVQRNILARKRLKKDFHNMIENVNRNVAEEISVLVEEVVRVVPASPIASLRKQTKYELYLAGQRWISELTGAHCGKQEKQRLKCWATRVKNIVACLYGCCGGNTELFLERHKTHCIALTKFKDEQQCGTCPKFLGMKAGSSTSMNGGGSDEA